MPHRETELTTTNAYEVTVLSDGTTTQAEINVKFSPFSSLHVLGSGVAKRRKWTDRKGNRRADPYDRDLGELLALRRAFKDAAMNCLREIEARGYDTSGL